jgi:hypothetical protein
MEGLGTACLLRVAGRRCSESPLLAMGRGCFRHGPPSRPDKKMSRFNAQSLCEPVDHIDGRTVDAAFDRTCRAEVAVVALPNLQLRLLRFLETARACLKAALQSGDDVHSTPRQELLPGHMQRLKTAGLSFGTAPTTERSTKRPFSTWKLTRAGADADPRVQTPLAVQPCCER